MEKKYGKCSKCGTENEVEPLGGGRVMGNCKNCGRKFVTSIYWMEKE